ncbi:MAG: hypothetical protein EBU14_16000, partial [Acetobacteraceae bacterium]|nr:hypothetical protein [Acetobacteraceae bacterium]
MRATCSSKAKPARGIIPALMAGKACGASCGTKASPPSPPITQRSRPGRSSPGSPRSIWPSPGLAF